MTAIYVMLGDYERGVQFRLGKLKDGPRGPGLIFSIPLIDHVRRVALRIVTMPIPGIAASSGSD
jgi:regulator of protease activity HflC (stomatin/prohibitin superfamily)